MILVLMGLVPGFESINLGATKYDFNDDNKGSKFKIEYRPSSLYKLGRKQSLKSGFRHEPRALYTSKLHINLTQALKTN